MHTKSFPTRSDVHSMTNTAKTDKEVVDTKVRECRPKTYSQICSGEHLSLAVEEEEVVVITHRQLQDDRGKAQA